MNQYRTRISGLGLSVTLVFMLTELASAASSLSNSLSGFTGDSTQAGTQAALGAAGFNVYSTAGLAPDFTSDPTITFDASGAHFGTLFGGDGGRNYMRTNASDYATVPFVAEITLDVTGPVLANQQAFFGMGSGDTALFGVPDWSSQNASTWVQPEISGGNPLFTTFRTNNDANQFVNFPAPGYVSGTHRMRMTFDPVAKTMVYAIDFNYTGGPFTADITAPTVDLNHVDCPTGCGNPSMPVSADFFGPDGWPTEPSRIYFGGDDLVTFRDFSVTVSATPALTGDYNNNHIIDAADYIVWRHLSGTGGTLPNDPTPGTIDSTDYDYWRSHFGATSGAGSALVASAAPEPASVVMLAMGLVGATGFCRRRKNAP